MYSSISPGVNTGFSKIGSDPCLQGLPSSGGEEFCVLTSSLLLCSPLPAAVFWHSLYCNPGYGGGVLSLLFQPDAAFCGSHLLSDSATPGVHPAGRAQWLVFFVYNPGVRECLPLSTCLLSAGIIPSSFISPSLPYIRCFFLTTLSKLTSDRLDAGLETPNMVFQDSKT